MRPTREMLRKGTHLALPTVRLGQRVSRVEESVRENALLAEPLERQVAGLEQQLVGLVQASVRRRRG